MIIQLSDTITSLQKDALLNSLSDLNIKSNEVKTQFKNYIIGIPKVSRNYSQCFAFKNLSVIF